MVTKQLEARTFMLGGFPQLIPAELTPEGVYEEKGVRDSIKAKVEFWRQTYSNEPDFPKTQFKNPKQELEVLENYYMQRLVTSDIETD